MSKNNKNTNINKIIQKYEERIRQLNEAHQKEINKIIAEHEELLHYNMVNIIDTMQTEFIYELASQMDYWNMKNDTDWHKFTKDSAKYRIEEIYRNVFKNIDGYSKMRDDKQVQKVYKFKKSKLNSEFNLKIDD